MHKVYTDRHICEKCGKPFEWNYVVNNRDHLSSSGLFNVYSLPVDIVLAYSFKENADGFYNVAVNCPHCKYDNHFVFIDNK